MARDRIGCLALLPLVVAGCASATDAASDTRTVEEIRELRGQVDRLQGELRSLQAERDSLKKDMAELKGENLSLVLGIDGLDGRQTLLEVEVHRLHRLLDAQGEPPPPAGSDREGELPRLPADAKVIAADARMDIHLVSVGTIHGVKSGDELTVYRGDLFVAVVVVDKAFDDKASVLVKKVDGKAFKKSDIQPGDRVARVH